MWSNSSVGTALCARQGILGSIPALVIYSTTCYFFVGFKGGPCLTYKTFIVLNFKWVMLQNRRVMEDLVCKPLGKPLEGPEGVWPHYGNTVTATISFYKPFFSYLPLHSQFVRTVLLKICSHRSNVGFLVLLCTFESVTPFTWCSSFYGWHLF